MPAPQVETTEGSCTIRYGAGHLSIQEGRDGEPELHLNWDSVPLADVEALIATWRSGPGTTPLPPKSCRGAPCSTITGKVSGTCPFCRAVWDRMAGTSA